jgi:hypothetical protein
MTIYLLLASGIIILNDYDQVCNYFLHYYQHFQICSNFIFVLPQITYGNMALIFPSHFQGYNKIEIFAINTIHDYFKFGLSMKI